MADKYLLNHIKTLESELKKIKEKEGKLQKIALNIKKLCQPILNIKVVNKDINTKIVKYLNTIINNLDGSNEEHHLYHKNGYMEKRKFFELSQKLDFKENLFFIFKLRSSKEIEFASSFIESKFTSLLVVDVTKVVGIIKKKDLKEFEAVKFIPFFNGSYEELKFFIIFFELNNLDEVVYDKANNLFDRFYLKPSMNDKSYVHYSLIEDKIIDFELIKKQKIKKEFSYINDLKYPEIENLIRKEIRNIRFVLALLDRIDGEMRDIKNSKGTIIVIKRILSFVYKNQLDPQIQQMTKLILEEINNQE